MSTRPTFLVLGRLYSAGKELLRESYIASQHGDRAPLSGNGSLLHGSTSPTFVLPSLPFALACHLRLDSRRGIYVSTSTARPLAPCLVGLRAARRDVSTRETLVFSLVPAHVSL